MLAAKLASFFKFSKLYSDPLSAIAGVKNGSFLLVGGFGFSGVPMNLVNAVRLSGCRDLTVASNSCGVDGQSLEDDWGLSMLLRTRQIKRLIFSHLGENVEAQRQYFNGEIELDVCPQGTFAEKIRCGGAGIPAFFTPTGAGTVVQEGGFAIKFQKTASGLEPVELSQPKPTSTFHGRKHLQEQAIFGDFALVKAWRADTMGNLEFHKTARNFNADMAKAARCVVAEVQEVVEPGALDPEAIHVPSLFVDRIYKMDPQSKYSEKVIERLTLEDHIETKRKVRFSDIEKHLLTFKDQRPSNLSKENIRYKIASRAAKEVRDGMNINLGIGMPTLLPEVLPPHIRVQIQSENGVLGVGQHPLLSEVDPDDINAGKETVTLLPGGSYFSSSDSFGMIRGGHLDVTMLGSFQVSESGDIANWMVPGQVMKGMGGAMDLVSSGSRVIVMMKHSALKKGEIEPKLVPKCTFPLTGRGVASMVITELAVFENVSGKLVLTELSDNVTLQEVQDQTGFTITPAASIRRF